MLTLRSMARILGDNRENFLPADQAERSPARVVVDSREIGLSDLFVCIRGERQDGHDFAFQAAERGATAILAEKDPFAGKIPPLPLLRVSDSVQALQLLAAEYRSSFRGRVAGITGSAGKTSIKEVLAEVLSVRGKTSRNFMNRNNRIGLPISILNADAEASFWVLEAGISEKRDMDELGRVLKPDLGLILNVGPAHLSGLGDRGAAYYKARLLTYLQPEGCALISADYPELLRESAAVRADFFTFSACRPEADYFAACKGQTASGRWLYRVRLRGAEFEAAAPFPGVYGAENVAAISGAAQILGLSPSEISAGLSRAVLPEQRFHCLTRGNFTLIDDSYNSNPLSAERMLRSASEMARAARSPLFLVMGDMLELGGESAQAHRRLGREMAVSGARAVFWKGEQGEEVRAGLREGAFGGFFADLREAEDFSAGLPALLDCLEKGAAGDPRGVILFKASRGLKLELLAEDFRKNFFCKIGI
ncbi:MAG: UDP-N-acetylmuramoyl-tripeptide--D-alanyl-D-alanine ligase [Deltaproteobacteria bacterium]|jgi:UDP-N-acetylmuramoyl-tripeptide--D-alanyl-D-alanine ligase|nr:UDP-N-acetylmuramoyl-tripeptide--D-alanyl-D-alanine ligase [Deltaproteobacteria bacterium]